MTDYIEGKVVPFTGTRKAPQREQEEYTDAFKEHVFGVYADPKVGKRSIRRTARIVEMSPQTLHHWVQKGGWNQKVYEQDAREAEIIKRSVEMRMINELENLLDNAFDLAYNGQPQDKTKAEMTKYMLGVMRVSPVQKVEQDILDTRLNRNRAVAESPEQKMSREELMARINALVEEPLTEAQAEFVAPELGEYRELPTVE